MIGEDSTLYPGAGSGMTLDEQIGAQYRVFLPKAEGQMVQLATTGRKAEMAARIHQQLMMIEAHELSVQSQSRYEQAIDARFYDGKAYDIATAQAMMTMGHFPSNYNWCAQRVDYLSGTQRRARADGKVLPRVDGNQAAQDARTKTTWLKYLSDSNKLQLHISEAGKMATVSGIAWLETGLRDDPTEKVPIYARMEPWWNVLYDSAWMEPDYTDGRYLLRNRAMDLDMAVAMFPKDLFPGAAARIRRSVVPFSGDRMAGWQAGQRNMSWSLRPDWSGEAIDVAFNGAPWLIGQRNRVMLREGWIRMPTRMQRQSGGSTYDDVKMMLWVAIYCDVGLLAIQPSPYAHGRIPFVPVIYKRRQTDGAPYGLVRHIRPANESFNKRMSKAQFHLSSRRLMIEKDAVDPSVMPLRQIREEAARPDAMLVLKPGGLAKVKWESGRESAEADLKFAELDMRFISLASGVTDENLGLPSNAQSGIAIERRQTEGAVTNTGFFDNMHMAQDEVGKHLLSMSEQFVTQQVDYYVAGSGAEQTRQFHSVNRYDPETGTYQNDLTAFEADFVMDRAPYHATMAQAAVADLMGMLENIGRTPNGGQVVLALLDLVVQQMDIPQRDLIVKRIRKINGQTDPDSPPSEEEQAEQQQQQQAQEAQQKLLIEKITAEIDNLKKKGRQLDAAATKSLVEAVFAAEQSAQVNATNPALAPVADVILKAAGMKPQDGVDPDIPPGGGQPALPAPGMPEQTTVAPQEPPPPQPEPVDMPAPDPANGATGANAGIETNRPQE